MENITFIVGPTATGKTEIAYLLAKEIKAEIVSCDAMLVYQEPAIITSKPAEHILREITHHFVGFIPVADDYSVFEYYRQATGKIKELYGKGVPVIVCGGSGLYFKALLDGIFEGIGKDEDFRKDLEKKAAENGKESLHRELEKIDPAAAEKISPNDLRRITRALEVYHLSGKPLSEQKKSAAGLYGKLPVKIFGLNTERELLYARINARTERMFAEGAIEEVRRLREMNLSLTSRKMIGIKEIGDFLDGKCDRVAVVEEMKKNTRRFAKRQLTWFNADKRIQWIDAGGMPAEEIKNLIIGNR